MENFNREHNNEYPPHSLLAAHSPLVSARKGFISRMGGGYYGTLEGFRVDTALFRILSRATDIERAIINEENESSDGVTFEKLCVQFGLENKEALFSSLQSDMEKYQQSDDYKNLDGSRKELVDIQAHRIMSSFRGFNENYRTRDSMPKPRSNSMRSSSIRRAFRRGRV
jgi:hypothetical protein